MKKENYKIIPLSFEKERKKRIDSGYSYSFLMITVGNCWLFTGEARRSCGPEDLILIKPGEAAVIEKIKKEYPLKLLWVQYSRELLLELSNSETDLEASLLVVPYTCTCVHADNEIITLIKNLSKRLCKVKQEGGVFANDIFEKGLLSILMVLILRACIYAEFREKPSGRRTFMLDNLFVYIREHLTEEITLDQLEKTFYVSKYHILREFKKETGQTVHRYIVKMKLELCKTYIVQGYPVTEVYKIGGFGGYNHFFRAFKQEYGMTPKEYYRREGVWKEQEGI